MTSLNSRPVGWRLFLEDEFHEGGVEVVSNFSVLFLFGNEFVCKDSSEGKHFKETILNDFRVTVRSGSNFALVPVRESSERDQINVNTLVRIWVEKASDLL